jgi:hypothetical protein
MPPRRTIKPTSHKLVGFFLRAVNAPGRALVATLVPPHATKMRQTPCGTR